MTTRRTLFGSSVTPAQPHGLGPQSYAWGLMLADATARARLGVSPRCAVEDLAVAWELTPAEIEHAIDQVEVRCSRRFLSEVQS